MEDISRKSQEKQKLTIYIVIIPLLSMHKYVSVKSNPSSYYHG